LKVYKNLYKAASEYKCSGCARNFAPVMFKAHVKNCSKLLSAGNVSINDSLLIRAVEYIADSQEIRLVCTGFGSQWGIK
jgi:hypothetical protein